MRDWKPIAILQERGGSPSDAGDLRPELQIAHHHTALLGRNTFAEHGRQHRLGDAVAEEHQRQAE